MLGEMLGNASASASSGSGCDNDSNLAGGIIMALLGVGTWISYLPTVYEIIALNSSKGISVGTMFLLNLTNYCNTLGLLLQNWKEVQCCNHGYDNAGDCMLGLNPVFLMGANILGCLPLYITTLWYWTPPGQEPEKKSILRDDDASEASSISDVSYVSQNLLDTPEFAGVKTTFGAWMSLALFFFVAATLAGVSAILLIEYDEDSNNVQRYADGCNLFSAIFMGLTWLPQLIHTYRIKHKGSLSVVTLLLQAPGAAIVCVSLITDGQSLTSIASNCVAFLCLSALFFMAVKYTYFKKDTGGNVHIVSPELDSDEEHLGKGEGVNNNTY